MSIENTAPGVMLEKLAELGIYLEMRTAIKRVDNGESYRSVAAETPHLSRVTLMDIHKDDDRRA